MPLFKNNPKFQKAYQTFPVRAAVFLICKAYCFIIAGYCLIPFAYLGIHKWWFIYGKFYYIGHIVILPMSIVWKPLIVKAVKMFYPLDKESVESYADARAPLNDQKSNHHEKAN
jgi:hypothetical protein